MIRIVRWNGCDARSIEPPYQQIPGDDLFGEVHYVSIDPHSLVNAPENLYEVVDPMTTSGERRSDERSFLRDENLSEMFLVSGKGESQ